MTLTYTHTQTNRHWHRDKNKGIRKAQGFAVYCIERSEESFFIVPCSVSRVTSFSALFIIIVSVSLIKMLSVTNTPLDKDHFFFQSAATSPVPNKNSYNNSFRMHENIPSIRRTAGSSLRHQRSSESSIEFSNNALMAPKPALQTRPSGSSLLSNGSFRSRLTSQSSSGVAEVIHNNHLLPPAQPALNGESPPDSPFIKHQQQLYFETMAEGNGEVNLVTNGDKMASSFNAKRKLSRRLKSVRIPSLRRANANAADANSNVEPDEGTFFSPAFTQKKYEWVSFLIYC